MPQGFWDYWLNHYAAVLGQQGSTQVCVAYDRPTSYSYEAELAEYSFSRYSVSSEETASGNEQSPQREDPWSLHPPQTPWPICCLDRYSGDVDSRSMLYTGWSLEETPFMCKMGTEVTLLVPRLNVKVNGLRRNMLHHLWGRRTVRIFTVWALCIPLSLFWAVSRIKTAAGYPHQCGGRWCWYGEENTGDQGNKGDCSSPASPMLLAPR